MISVEPEIIDAKTWDVAPLDQLSIETLYSFFPAASANQIYWATVDKNLP
jgi:hypothetical protein